MFSYIYIATIILVCTKQKWKHELSTRNCQQGKIIFNFNNLIDYCFPRTLNKFNEYKKK